MATTQAKTELSVATTAEAKPQTGDLDPAVWWLEQGQEGCPWYWEPPDSVVTYKDKEAVNKLIYLFVYPPSSKDVAPSDYHWSIGWKIEKNAWRQIQLFKPTGPQQTEFPELAKRLTYWGAQSKDFGTRTTKAVMIPIKEFSLVQRQAIEALAVTIPVKRNLNKDWNCQDWTIRLLQVMVDSRHHLELGYTKKHLEEYFTRRTRGDISDHMKELKLLDFQLDQGEVDHVVEKAKHTEVDP